MKAVALTGLRKLEVIEAPSPRLAGDGDVLLQVEKVGVCGSDLHYYETGRIGTRAVQFPFVIGHECSATVVETGRSVKRVRPGDRVAVDPAVSCHECDQCRQGRPHTCRRLAFLGCPGELPGCLCEWLVMPEASLYPVSDAVTLEQAALCEPLSIALYAVRQNGVRPGARVAILGAGPIGLSVLLAARQHGITEVAVTDRLAERVEVARRAGSAWAGNPDREDVVSSILALEPAGMDAVFECAGQQEALDQAVKLLKPGGRLSIIGIPRAETVGFNIDLLRRKEITVINVRRQNHCVQAAVDLVTAGALQPDFLVTHRFRPEATPEAFELVAGYRDGVIKAMIQF
jgi:L-iditol 2-dehydrogenase